MSKFTRGEIVAEKADSGNSGIIIMTPDENANGRYQVEFSDGIVEFDEGELMPTTPSAYLDETNKKHHE